MLSAIVTLRASAQPFKARGVVSDEAIDAFDA
jgi:hypothetical protein